MGDTDTDTETEHATTAGPEGWAMVAACDDLQRRDGRTVIYHEQRRHAWVQSDAAVDLPEMQ